MKNIILFLLFLGWFANTGAQIVINDGAYFVVKSGTKIIASDGIVSSDGTIDNDGTIYN